MEKYRKLPREKTAIKEDEIRVTSTGRFANYIVYGTRIFTEQNRNAIVIKATGNAIARAVNLAETLKRRIPALHQITKCGSTTLTDIYEPLEEGLDTITHERMVSFIDIMLSKEEATINKEDPGYQPPLDEALVKAVNAEEAGRWPRGGGRGGRGGFRGGYRGGYGRGRFPRDISRPDGRQPGLRNERNERNDMPPRRERMDRMDRIDRIDGGGRPFRGRGRGSRDGIRASDERGDYNGGMGSQRKDMGMGGGRHDGYAPREVSSGYSRGGRGGRGTRGGGGGGMRGRGRGRDMF